MTIFFAFFCLIGYLLVGMGTSSKSEFFLSAAEKYVNNKSALISLLSDYVKNKENSEFHDILEGLGDYFQEVDEYDDSRKKKHVLTILSDDQGHADIGYVDPTIVSPTVDKLAGLGVKFNSFYVQVNYYRREVFYLLMLFSIVDLFANTCVFINWDGYW